MVLKKVILFVTMLLSMLLMTACSNKTYIVEIHQKDDSKDTPKRVLLFLDGTANDRDSRTNVSKLFEIFSNQNLDNSYMFYNEGVGTAAFGSATAWGIGTDVKQAYSFLSQYYDKESSLHFYGFSRGAYTARILAGMIYTVGIYDLKHLSEEQREKIIDKLYDAYKGGNIFLNEEKSFKAIRNDSRDVINEWSDGKIFLISDNVKIKVMGLWDTVEALGVTQTIESIKDTFGIEDPQKIENPNKRYFDQICNIENTFHAIALDDNRANVFTPIILTGNEVIRRCEDNLSMKDRIANQIIHVDEVWFSGAHADVGGGYKLVSEKGKITEDNSLSGVSLNWMLSKIKTVDTKLFPVNFNVYENILGFIHDAESYPLVNNALYKNGTRANIIKKYLDVSNYNTMKIHTSVVDRLNKKIDNNNYNSKWYLSNSKCINKENKDLYTTTTKCVKVNNDQSLK